MYQVKDMLNIYCWVFLKVLVAVVENNGLVAVPKVLVAVIVISVGLVAIVGLVAVIDIYVELVAVVGLVLVVVISSASMRKYQQKFDYY